MFVAIPTAMPAEPLTTRFGSFDGRTFNRWEGDPKYWRVDAGDMVGEITPDTIVKSNTFLIWRGGEPADIPVYDFATHRRAEAAQFGRHRGDVGLAAGEVGG